MERAALHPLDDQQDIVDEDAADQDRRPDQDHEHGERDQRRGEPLTSPKYGFQAAIRRSDGQRYDDAPDDWHQEWPNDVEAP